MSRRKFATDPWIVTMIVNVHPIIIDLWPLCQTTRSAHMNYRIYSWKFSQVNFFSRFWIIVVNIFVVVSAPWPRPLLASVANARDPGIKIFAVNIFVDCVSGILLTAKQPRQNVLIMLLCSNSWTDSVWMLPYKVTSSLQTNHCWVYALYHIRPDWAAWPEPN